MDFDAIKVIYSSVLVRRDKIEWLGRDCYKITENSESSYIGIWSYKNGEMHGSCFGWYNKGRCHFLSNYKDGLLDGELKIYNKDGKIITNNIYKNGKLLHRGKVEVIL